MYVIADQPDVIFAKGVSTVSNILCHVKLCLLTVLIDLNVW